MAIMNAPQTFAQGETAKIRMEAMINAEVALYLADMASLRQYITYVGDTNGTGSDTVRYRLVGLGAYAPFTAVNDGTALTAADMEAKHADVVVSRSGIAYDLTDLFSSTGLGRDVDPFFVAETMSMSAEARMNQIICTSFDGATVSKGSAASVLSLSDFLDALYALEEANNGNDLSCVLKNKQFSDLQKNLRFENNNFVSAQAEMAMNVASAKPQGYAGNLMGVNIFRSDYVQENAATTAWVGAMFSSRGIGYATGSPDLVGATSVYRVAGSPLTVEFSRESKSGISSIIGHLYMGASILEDERIVKLISIK